LNEGLEDLKNVKMKDLANMAGVSTATVSRALAGSPLVNPRTRKDILRLARENGYKQLISAEPGAGSNMRFNIVVPRPQGRLGWLDDAFFLELLGGIGQAAHTYDCDFVVSHIVPRTMDDLMQLNDEEGYQGTIFLGQSSLHNMLNRMADISNSFIAWGAELPGQRYCSVGSNNVKGGEKATRHLARLGRRRIAFLGNREAPEVQQRYEGYVIALSNEGIDFDPDLVITAPFEIESSSSITRSIFERHRDIDAIFASSDTIAIGVISGLQAMGIEVPKKVSVVGYDDIFMSRFVSPPLSTIRQDFAAAGRLIISKLLHLSTGEQMVSERLPTEIVVRNSCGA
jgi:DNA-binding LacI/PurR family transcriptional regulator